MRKLVVVCSILLLAAWALLIWLTFVFPGVVDGWESQGLTLSNVQIWLANTSRWMEGQINPNQIIPGAVFASAPLLVATMVVVIWAWVLHRSSQAARSAAAQ